MNNKTNISENYYEFIKNKIISKFKSPVSAVFPKYEESMLNITKKKSNNYAEILTYIDSQNSYGAMIRTQVKITLDENFNFLSVKIKEHISLFWIPFSIK